MKFLSIIRKFLVPISLSLNGSPSTAAGFPVMPDVEAVWQQAEKMLQQHKYSEARSSMQDAVDQVAAIHGKKHPHYAAARFKQSFLFAAMGEWEEGAAACREAAAIEGTDETSRKARLTYGMNEAEHLQIAGKTKEALEVMKQNVALRADFYGKDHSGYAYGMAELSSAQLLNGLIPESLASANEAVEIDLRNENPHVAQCAFHQSVSACAAGKSHEAFSCWPQLSEALRHQVVVEVQTHYRKFPVAGLVTPLVRLASALRQTPSSEGTDLRIVLAMVSNFAKEANLHEPRIDALREISNLVPKGSAERIESLKALAIALADAGKNLEGLNLYDQAAMEAAEAGLLHAAAGCYREKALALANDGPPEAAAAAHQLSVKSARTTKDPELIGKALTCQGIFLHHAGKMPEAVVLLEEASNLLPADHRDIYYLLNHLVPARKGQPCRCSEQGDDTIATMLKVMLVKEMGEGFIDEIVPTPDEDIPYSVKLLKDPTEAESRKLEAAWTNCYEILRRRLLEK